jgi:hypothetical protein
MNDILVHIIPGNGIQESIYKLSGK